MMHHVKKKLNGAQPLQCKGMEKRYGEGNGGEVAFYTSKM